MFFFWFTVKRILIRFASDHNMSKIIWQLGNEPNSFKHEFNLTISGAQLGRDFLTLKNLLTKFPMFKDSLLVGPDINRVGKCYKLKTCEPLEYLDDVVTNANGALDALTWHHYYLDGKKVDLSIVYGIRVIITVLS